MELQLESESAAVPPSLLAAIETRAAKPVSLRFDIGMRDFVDDAAFLRENRPSLSLKVKELPQIYLHHFHLGILSETRLCNQSN